MRIDCNLKIGVSQNFKGILLPQGVAKTADEAIEKWGYFANKAYTSLGDSYTNYASNLSNNEKNFHFLDNLLQFSEKKKFIEHFKRVTGFPNLADVSSKIVNEFNRVTSMIENKFAFCENNQLTEFVNISPYEIILRGYNPTSSVGLQKALPGSDLNGAFVVFNGTGVEEKDNLIRRQYLTILNDNVDHRILSFNHEEAVPKVMSLREIILGLKEIDASGNNLFQNESQVKSTISQRLNYAQYVPGESDDYSARYNIALARTLQPDQRLFARDLAIIMEGIRDGVLTKRQEAVSLYVQDEMNKSLFAWCTNFLQIHALENGLGSTIPYKTKITEREKLKDFEQWSVDKQFECVKNVIKHMADDSSVSNEYQAMMTNKNCKIASSLRAYNNNLLFGNLFKYGTSRFFGE